MASPPLTSPPCRRGDDGLWLRGGLSLADALASAGGTVFDQMTELIEVLDHSPTRIG